MNKSNIQKEDVNSLIYNNNHDIKLNNLDNEINKLEQEIIDLQNINRKNISKLKEESGIHIQEINSEFNKELYAIDLYNADLEKQNSELLLLFNKLKSITNKDIKKNE